MEVVVSYFNVLSHHSPGERRAMKANHKAEIRTRNLRNTNHHIATSDGRRKIKMAVTFQMYIGYGRYWW